MWIYMVYPLPGGYTTPPIGVGGFKCFKSKLTLCSRESCRSLVPALSLDLKKTGNFTQSPGKVWSNSLEGD